LLLGVVLLLLLGSGLQKPLDHDEHQFISSGVLLGKYFRLPYLDFPYFHMPNLVFIYAVLFRFSDFLLLSARVFSTLCAWLMLMLMYLNVLHLFREHKPGTRLLFAAGSVLLVLLSPLFAYTSGKAWNHDLPVLLILAAFFLFFEAVKRGNQRGWFFASGLLVGLAIGTRLSYATTVFPFLILFWMIPQRGKSAEQVKLALFFLLGLAASLLPSLVLFILAPRQFIFGNFGYAAYNTFYRQQQGFSEGELSSTAMSLAGKLKFLVQQVLFKPEMALLVLVFIIFLWFIHRIWKSPLRLQFALAGLLLPFLILGSLAPTPAWYQYFYPLVPFLVLALVFGIAALYPSNIRIGPATVVFLLILGVFLFSGVRSYQDLGSLWKPSESLAMRVHEMGEKIASRAAGRQVLTLAPLFPLEGGAAIYEEFATGAFGWRVAPFIPAKERQAAGLVAESDLEDFIVSQPVSAILTGYEETLERSLLEMVKLVNFKPVKLTADKTLWLAPP
jgi:4-amino-4-deoxy-L-arabinose transferase-like glycosyltransferase